MTHVYVVGRWEEHFVCDRVYDNLQDAIDYCESRKCDKYAWDVMNAPLGGDWLNWTSVHHTKRKEPTNA